MQFELSFLPGYRASFLAASSKHSGDWLYALPVTSCGMRLDDEAVRVAIGLRLGLELCVPHQCHCGAKWTHSDAMYLFAERPPADQFDTML